MEITTICYKRQERKKIMSEILLLKYKSKSFIDRDDTN